MHDNGVGVHDGQAPGPPSVELHGALDHGRGPAGRAVVPGVRQHRFKVPQGRRGDHGVHVGGRRRGRHRDRRRRRPGRLVVRCAGRQKLRVPVVGHFHGRRVPVRVAGVQDCVPGVQQQEAERPVERRPNAPVLFASAAARQRRQPAQVRETSGHHRPVTSGVNRRRTLGTHRRRRTGRDLRVFPNSAQYRCKRITYLVFKFVFVFFFLKTAQVGRGAIIMILLFNCVCLSAIQRAIL